MPGTPHFPTLTASRPVVFFPVIEEEGWDGVEDDYVSGAVATRGRRSKARRHWRWTCDVLDEADKDLVMGFLSDREAGGHEPFYWDSPVNNAFPPYDAPTLGQTAGGALGARTYYVKVTWAGASTGETTPSQEGSQAVDANKYLTVACRTFPAGVDHANIYIGTASGQLYYSGRIATSNTTWTEDSASTTVDADSASGQKVLNVAATTNFQVGGVVRINSGGPRQEDGVIDSIQAGVSLTLVANLQYTHTALQADAVATIVGASTQATPPAANNLSEEIYVLLRGNPMLSRTKAVNLWSLEFDLLEMWP